MKFPKSSREVAGPVKLLLNPTGPPPPPPPLGAAIDAAPWAKSALVIPPYTKVKIEMVCEETDGNNFASMSVVGRTYRG